MYFLICPKLSKTHILLLNYKNNALLNCPKSKYWRKKSLSPCSKVPESVKQLQQLTTRCSTVIACRLSPIQKSQLVRLVKGKRRVLKNHLHFAEMSTEGWETVRPWTQVSATFIFFQQKLFHLIKLRSLVEYRVRNLSVLMSPFLHLIRFVENIRKCKKHFFLLQACLKKGVHLT